MPRLSLIFLSLILGTLPVSSFAVEKGLKDSAGRILYRL